VTTPAYEARAAAELAEYGTFEAVADIYFNGLVAYRPGHPVPVSNVERYRYDEQGLVRRVDDVAPADDGEDTAPLEGLPPVPPAA